MNRIRGRSLKPVRCLALALGLLALPATAARAQFPGYGGFYGPTGYGYPAAGFGYPGYGYGYPGVGYGYGYGYPGPGYPGYSAFGYSYGYPGFGYSGYVSGYGGFSPYIVPGYVEPNPLFGLGLTPLGLQSAVAESSIIQGAGGYRVRFGAPGRGVVTPYRP